MTLWGNIDYMSGNLKPLFANTTNTTSNSVINGTTANVVYGQVVGVSTLEQTRANGTPQAPTHAGWVSMKIGTGPAASISVSGGTGINTGGYFIITDNSLERTGSGANVSFSIANSQNIMQSYSANSNWNVINSIAVVSGGSGYSNASAITVLTNGTAIANATLGAILGGRAGRINTEVLVAMGSISGDNPTDNTYFTGI